MFARTERLLLRPGWQEDAPALARAIGEEAVVRNLATAPWPYDESEARAFLSMPLDPAQPLVTSIGPDGEPGQLQDQRHRRRHRAQLRAAQSGGGHRIWLQSPGA